MAKKIQVFGQLPNENEVLLAKVDTAGEAIAVKKEYMEVFKAEGITTRVATIEE